ncbi:MAG: DUF4386 domain-containing protein [Chloroflexi bacterium]|nr:DUF4386 domain-containing protein [Chloroflexota bacterium]
MNSTSRASPRSLARVTGGVALSFFAVNSVMVGYIMWRSGLVPRAVGASLVLSGIGWMTFFVLPVAAMLIPYNVIIGALGEAVVILWLVVMGASTPLDKSIALVPTDATLVRRNPA